MEQLADEFAGQGYRFIFVYVREAHPGENYPHHTSFAQKLAHARAFRDQLAIRRTILVDDLAGTIHQAYGTLPNMTYVISRSGVVTFKSDWTDPETIRFAIQYQVQAAERRGEGARLAPFYVELQGLRWNDPARFQERLALAGPKAVAEFAAYAAAVGRRQ
jgi:hypothetical protein